MLWTSSQYSQVFEMRRVDDSRDVEVEKLWGPVNQSVVMLWFKPYWAQGLNPKLCVAPRARKSFGDQRRRLRRAGKGASIEP